MPPRFVGGGWHPAMHAPPMPNHDRSWCLSALVFSPVFLAQRNKVNVWEPVRSLNVGGPQLPSKSSSLDWTSAIGSCGLHSRFGFDELAGLQTQCIVASYCPVWANCMQQAFLRSKRRTSNRPLHTQSCASPQCRRPCAARQLRIPRHDADLGMDWLWILCRRPCPG